MLIPSVFWAAIVALADLAVYPLVTTPAAPGCDVPAPAIAYSADHLVRVLTLFFAFLVLGTVVFAVARLFRQKWLAGLGMAGVCLALSAFSFDHDYPMCNSFSPKQSLTLALAIFVLPTLAVWVAWRLRRWGWNDFSPAVK